MKQHAANLSGIAILAAFAILGCFGGSQHTLAAGTNTAATAWTTTRTVAVNDPATNMRAYTLQVPTGWKFAGMMMRPGGCHPPSVPADGLSFTALAPDGITAYEKLPGVSWAWATDGTNPGNPKCAPVEISTAAEFLLNIAIPNLRPDAKNITLVPPTPRMQQALDAARHTFASETGPMRHSADTARIRLQYTLKGHPVEELIGTFVTCMEASMPAYPMLHRAALTRHICQSTGVNIRRAPQGALDALIAKDLPPATIDPQWDSYIQQNMRAQFAQWQKVNDEQFKAIQQHYQDVTNGMLQKGRDFQAQQKSSFDNAMAQDRATQGAIDHAAQMQVRDSLNRADFIDPTTGRKIETSNQYSHNWISSDGQSVVLNGDPTYDPNGVVDPVRQSWTELIPIN
jgi:hypothetical protein